MLRFIGETYSKLASGSCRARMIRLQVNTNALRSSSDSSSINKPQDVDAPVFDMPNPYEKERIQCVLCKHNILPDYKNVRLLSQFQSPYTGRIYGRHITGLCKKQQELVEKEITKAQSAGLMPVSLKEPEFLRDPELFDVEKPLRPHRF